MHAIAPRLRAAALPMAAIVTAVLLPAATLLVAGDTLGYDFRAYYAAAARVLAGAPAYDPSITVAGPYGQFLYPPTFLPLVLPFALLDVTAATWLWTVLIAAANVAAIGLMPIRSRARWLTLLLAAQMWPALYALKLGQVGALLVLLFVLGWRALEPESRAGAPRTAAVLGVAGAIGAAIKLQPGLVLVWALLTRRGSAVIAGTATLAILALAATVVAGPEAWPAFVKVIGNVADPVGTPHNLTPGAVAFGLGVSRQAATLVQVGSMALVLLLAGWSALRLPAVPSYLIAVVATQLVSPVLWDHYAIVLLVPVAWLLDRGCRAAVLVPLALSVMTLGFMPPVAYPVAFAFTLVLLTVQGRRQRVEAVGRY